MLRLARAGLHRLLSAGPPAFTKLIAAAARPAGSSGVWRRHCGLNPGAANLILFETSCVQQQMAMLAHRERPLSISR
jgi:hypothetical protein